MRASLNDVSYAGIAQLVERLTCNEDVASSNLVSGSILARMAELVDALASGASNRKVVEVRVFFRAPAHNKFQSQLIF